MYLTTYFKVSFHYANLGMMLNSTYNMTCSPLRGRIKATDRAIYAILPCGEGNIYILPCGQLAVYTRHVMSR